MQRSSEKPPILGLASRECMIHVSAKDEGHPKTVG